LVEHLVWDQGVVGSNPVFPIRKQMRKLDIVSSFFFYQKMQDDWQKAHSFV